MVPGFDVTASIRRMNALIAAIQALPEERQDAAMRQYIECGLDKLQSLESDYYEFLGECVLLAIDNMQDVRLQSLEKRVDALEHPDGPSFADVLTDAAIVFGLSMAALLLVEGGGALVLAYFGQKALAPTVHKLAVETEEAFVANATKQMKSLAELQARRNVLIEQRRGLPAVLDALRRGSIGDFAWQLGKSLMSPLTTARSVLDALAKTFKVSAEADAILTELLIGQMALTEGLERVIKTRLEYEAKLAGDALRPDTKWRNFLDTSTSGLALAPAFSVFDGIKQKIASEPVGASTPSAAKNSVFLTSTPAGKILSWVRDKRMAIGENYSVLRAAMRFRKDESLADDSFVSSLAGLINELVPLWNSYRTLQDSVRPLIVQGYEAALWWAYFQSNGMLDLQSGENYVSYDRGYVAGDIDANYVIRSVPPKAITRLAERGESADRTEYHYNADYYPGLQRLTDVPTEDLYERFCKPYFAIKANADKLPFVYDPRHYQGVLDQPKEYYLGFVTNSERVNRLNQMRLMVIVFFRNLPDMTDATSTGLLNQLGEITGTPPSAERWIALNPAGSAAKSEVQSVFAPGLRSQTAAAEGLTALVADTGMLDEPYFWALRNDLRTAINALRNDIDDHRRLSQGVAMPGETGRGLDEEEYWQLIKEAQSDLLTTYATVVNAAKFDTTQQKEIENEYRALVEYLASWPETTPTLDADSQPNPWHFQPGP